MALTKDDKKFLVENFATKEDLKPLAKQEAVEAVRVAVNRVPKKWLVS